MFSVTDIMGLNPGMRKMLANAAGAACGMASTDVEVARLMTNLARNPLSATVDLVYSQEKMAEIRAQLEARRGKV